MNFFFDCYSKVKKDCFKFIKLQEIPKVKRQALQMSRHGLGSKSEPVFILGYPWTNTLQDQHVLIEGSTGITSILIKLNIIQIH